MTSGLIFDLDGTLVDSLPGIAASLNRGLSSLGRSTHPEATVRSFIGDGMRILAARALGEEAVDQELVETLFRKCAGNYASTWNEGTTPYPGIHGLLAGLKNQRIPLAVLSNKPHAFTTEIVGKLFPATFDLVIGQRDGMPHKPEPDGALEACRILGIEPAASHLIGDSVIDLETARRAGLGSIAVTWGYHDADRLAAADHLAESIPDLASLIAKILPI